MQICLSSSEVAIWGQRLPNSCKFVSEYVKVNTKKMLKNASKVSQGAVHKRLQLLAEFWPAVPQEVSPTVQGFSFQGDLTVSLPLAGGHCL